MGKYVVKFHDLVLKGLDEYELSSDYEFYNQHGFLNIECNEEACEKKEAHPSLLRDAIFLALPSQVISPYCSNEIYSPIWRSAVLFSYYTDTDYQRNGVIEIDEENLRVIKNWYGLLSQNVVEREEKKNFWNFAFDEYLDTCGVESIEQNYLALTIALEALFVSKEDNISKQLTNNTARFLCEEITERNQMQKFLRNMYTIRCKVAHGNIDALIRLLNKGDLFEKFLEYRAVVAEALRRTYGLDKKAILQDIRAKNKPAIES